MKKRNWARWAIWVIILYMILLQCYVVYFAEMSLDNREYCKNNEYAICMFDDLAAMLFTEIFVMSNDIADLQDALDRKHLMGGYYGKNE